MTVLPQNPTRCVATVPSILGSESDAAQQIRVDDDLTAYVVSRPGQVLEISTHRAIYDALIPMTSESFGADQTTYWMLRRREGYLERLAESSWWPTIAGSS